MRVPVSVSIVAVVAVAAVATVVLLLAGWLALAFA